MEQKRGKEKRSWRMTSFEKRPGLPASGSPFPRLLLRRVTLPGPALDSGVRACAYLLPRVLVVLSLMETSFLTE